MSEGGRSLNRPAVYALVAVGVYLAYLVLRPFIAALVWAVIFAMLFRRMQVALAKKTGPVRAASLTTIVAGLAIAVPGVVLFSALQHEAPRVSGYLNQTSRDAPHQIQVLWDAARARSPVALPEDPTELITNASRRALAFLASHAGAAVTDLFAQLGTLAAMLFALFFMLRDGDTLRKQLRDRLPFSDEENDSLLDDTRDLVIASVGAALGVAVAQGILGGVAFRLVGIGAPAFWGVVMGFSSLLPVVGATLIWVPATIGFFLTGEIGRGVALLLMGIFGISMVDNWLRPAILSGKTSVSGPVVFFGLLGGAAAFGLLGLVIGPIILVVTGRVLEIARRHDAPQPDATVRPCEEVA